MEIIWELPHIVISDIPSEPEAKGTVIRDFTNNVAVFRAEARECHVGFTAGTANLELKAVVVDTHTVEGVELVDAKGNSYAISILAKPPREPEFDEDWDSIDDYPFD